MASLYWINDAIYGILPTLWMIFGLGLPWAYAILSTKRWNAKVMVMAVALAIGPAWMTAWMLVLGVIGAQFNLRLFTPEWILSGSLLIALAGVLITWWKRKSYIAKSVQESPLAFDEKLIISLIVLAVIIRWIHTAFWTFTAYDTLWVYGYQSRLYFLEGFIPHSIDYYPQFVQLQYTYVQVMVGAMNDHAARMVIPMMHIGSILAAYLLGKRVFNRRAGLFTAALWSLHPYVGQWAFIGDLEIPLTFSFTMAATFFLSAWLEKEDHHTRRNDAILAGLMLGVAMYTKPTAGAFIWGVMLAVAVELLRVRFQFRLWLPRFKVAFWTGLASMPLGAAWYIRNVALGHDAIKFPPALWLDYARRSGDHLNWLVLAVIVGFVLYGMLRKISLRRFIMGMMGIVLLLLGVLPSNPALFPQRFDPPYSYITLSEAGWIVAGLLIIVFALLPDIRQQLVVRASRTAGIVGWAWLLALPYFVTWFYSYSYHYRLGFAIVPLLVLPTAIMLAHWLTGERIQQWRRTFRTGYYVTLILLSLPGIVSVAVDVTWSSVWFLNEKLDSDDRKYQVFNPALMEVYFALNHYIFEEGELPIVVAPGEQRLHFFYPQMQIIDRPIQTLNEFETLNATHFLYGTQARWAYERAGMEPASTQMVASLGRLKRFEEIMYHSDATFSYALYWNEDDRSRFRKAKTASYPIVYSDTDIVFGDVLRFEAEGISPQRFFKSEKILLTSAWYALQPIHKDYLFVYELFNQDTSRIEYQWVLHIAPHRFGYYSTRLWDVRERVGDHQFVRISKSSDIPDGENYVIRVRVLDPVKNRYLPVTIDGQPGSTFFTLSGQYRVG